MSRTLAARVRFFGPEEGGYSRPPLAGIQPLLQIGPVFTSIVVRPKDPGVSAFQLDGEYEVTIEVRFWDDYGHLVSDGMPVRLFDGKRQIADGTLLERVEAPSGGAGRSS